jgi:ferritin
MTFSERTAEAMNRQLMRELEASYTYLSMAGYCHFLGLDGFAHWLEEQSSEELRHARKFRRFIQDRGERVHYESIPEPDSDFSSILEVFERALAHEQSVTQSINDLYALAEEEKDFASQSFLDWFVTEQVEEEKTVSGIIDWLRRLQDTPHGLYLLDRQLGGNVEAGSGGESATDEGPAPLR